MITWKLHQPYKSDIKNCQLSELQEISIYLSNQKDSRNGVLLNPSISICFNIFQYISSEIFGTSQITTAKTLLNLLSASQPEVVHLVQSSTQKQSWSHWCWLHLGDRGVTFEIPNVSLQILRSNNFSVTVCHNEGWGMFRIKHLKHSLTFIFVGIE